MTDQPKPPQTYQDFTARFPKLAEAWQTIGEAAREGPLDQKTARLVKLGIAIGAFREGPVHSSVRKALALGITQEELEHVVTLAVGTVGFPSAVAAFTWIHDEL